MKCVEILIDEGFIHGLPSLAVGCVEGRTTKDEQE